MKNAKLVWLGVFSLGMRWAGICWCDNRMVLQVVQVVTRHFQSNEHFFLLQVNPTYMKLILHMVSVKNITFL